MNEIRAAKRADFDSLMEMGRQFFDESSFASFTSFDEDSFAATISALFSKHTAGALLVVDNGRELVGMAGSVIYPLYFNLNTRIGQEIFWFIKQDYRTGIGDTLLAELEKDAMQQGASVFISASLAGDRDKAMNRLYRRKGYQPLENAHIRKFAS